MTKKGFTLVELMVVIVIIAILAVIGLAIFTDVLKEARNAKRRGDIDAISKALESHYNRVANQYCNSTAAGLYCTPNGSWFNNGLIPTDPNGTSYQNIPSAASATYNICATLEASQGISPTQICKSNLR